MDIDLTAPEFHHDDAAREWLEQSRWPNGPVCPHCGCLNSLPMGGTKHRAGLLYCPDCRGQFTVLTGSVMERSHIPLPKWVLGIRLLTGSKKGFSAHQLHRTLKVTYKTAWFMAHRIREAMTDPTPTPIGGEGKIVEADEAYHGKRETPAVLSRGRVRKPTKSGKAGGGEAPHRRPGRAWRPGPRLPHVHRQRQEHPREAGHPRGSQEPAAYRRKPAVSEGR
jgi:transposase-like protein